MIIAIENQSAFERNVLANFKGGATTQLVYSLSAGVALFHNVLSNLQHAGVRMRIIPRGKKLSDTPGFESLRHQEEVDQNTQGIHSTASGVYHIGLKIVAVRQDALIDGGENPYYVLVHEFAHAIWYELMSGCERGEIAAIYAKELARQPPERTYRLSNVDEFFAESFTYFVTPKLPELIIDETPSQFKTLEAFMTSEEKNKVGLKWANIEMSNWLERKFKNIIDPSLIQCSGEKGGFWDRDEHLGLCIQTYRDYVRDFSDIEVVTRDITHRL